MADRLRNFVRNLTGKSDATLVDHLLQQLDATSRGADLARQMVTGAVATDLGIEQMSAIEGEGDDARRDLIAQLRRSLATPIDREDLNRLSRSVDDILDNLRDLAYEFHLYELVEEPLLTEGIDNLSRGIDDLTEATNSLIERPEEAAQRAAESKKNDVRRSYQQAMAELLTSTDEVDTRLLRRRELLRRLDITGLRLAEAADALADGAVKRSH